MTDAQTPSPPDANQSRQDRPDGKGPASASPDGAPDRGIQWPRTGTATPPGSESLALSPAKGALWPSALGWLMIVWAGQHFLLQAATRISALYQELFDPNTRYAAWPKDIVPGGMLLVIVLALGGAVLLLARRRAGHVLLVLWCIAWGAVVVANAVSFSRYFSAWSAGWRSGVLAHLVDLPRSLALWGFSDLLLGIGAMVWLLRPTVFRQVKTWRDPQVRRLERHAPPGSRWPEVVAVILIVHGGLWIWQQVVTWTGLMTDPELHEYSLHGLVLGWYVIAPTAFAVFGFAVAWCLCRRRPSAAVLGVVLGVVSVMHALGTPLVETIRFGPGDVRTGRLLFQVTCSLGRAAWPAFLLIWFLRPPIRAQVRGWRVRP